MSEPFYTRPGGYKLGLQVISIGDSYGTDTHVGVCVYLKKDEYDESLKWPFNGEITLQLLNWREDKGHVEKTIEHYKTPIESRNMITIGNAAYAGKAFPNFISHNDLEYNANYNTEYIHNDKLCFVISKIFYIETLLAF